MIGKRKLAAVGYVAFGGAAVKGYQPRRKIHPLQPRKPKSSESMKPVATSAKKLDNARIARQLGHAQLLESLHGSMDGLLGRFKPQVRSLPRIQVSSFRDTDGVIHFVSSCSSLTDCVGVRETGNPLYLVADFRSCGVLDIRTPARVQ